ncbi:ABC transporter ATP-binding protein [Micromonospora sp. SL4-19]|uniref:ABC transporter ATP-binding protein n=1 Tax=Micromonospora sp. SL4-19 TaxID=3399129 RepID=UPI003A4D6A7A
MTSGSPPVLVDVQAVTHTHGRGAAAVTVLHGVTVEIGGGVLVALAGRSGSGKSTLCHLVAGVMAPSAGRVCVKGEPATAVRDWASVALAPQRLALVGELTVAENVHLPALLRRAPVDPGLLARMGLERIARRPARETSLGEQQRTALARALVLAPALAVLDEPTAHQDDGHVEQVVGALRESVRRGTTVLVATHDPRLIEVADIVLNLHSGRLVPDAVGRGAAQSDG